MDYLCARTYNTETNRSEKESFPWQMYFTKIAIPKTSFVAKAFQVLVIVEFK